MLLYLGARFAVTPSGRLKSAGKWAGEKETVFSKNKN